MELLEKYALSVEEVLGSSMLVRSRKVLKGLLTRLVFRAYLIYTMFGMRRRSMMKIVVSSEDVGVELQLNFLLYVIEFLSPDHSVSETCRYIP